MPAAPGRRAITAPSRRATAPLAAKRSATQATIAKTATDTKPLELLVKNGEFYQTYRIDYHGGERYPHLTRNPATPDVISAIIAPKRK